MEVAIALVVVFVVAAGLLYAKSRKDQVTPQEEVQRLLDELRQHVKPVDHPAIVREAVQGAASVVAATKPEPQALPQPTITDRLFARDPALQAVLDARDAANAANATYHSMTGDILRDGYWDPSGTGYQTGPVISQPFTVDQACKVEFSASFADGANQVKVKVNETDFSFEGAKGFWDAPPGVYTLTVEPKIPGQSVRTRITAQKS